ncbi:MAG: AbrB/MazE/SpoVT family DNA-binding domain-containing protein [Planctomycetes bacterium]|nr:AbrB/MazE/SpoVT family DNA-binding domain-containing protein [Planctomycetota bacterium]
MATVKLTSKRQATLPSQLCEEMGVHPGDDLLVEPKVINGDRFWILKPEKSTDDWMGALRSYAKGKSHDMEDIRSSIGKRTGKDKA